MERVPNKFKNWMRTHSQNMKEEADEWFESIQQEHDDMKEMMDSSDESW